MRPTASGAQADPFNAGARARPCQSGWFVVQYGHLLAFSQPQQLQPQRPQHTSIGFRVGFQYTNKPPTDLNFTEPLSIAENQPITTIVGEFNASDPDLNTTLNYYFVSGDNNNSLFNLEANGTLRTATIFDYETNAPSYSIHLGVKDEFNASVEGNFTVALTNVIEDIDGDGTEDFYDDDMDGDGFSNAVEENYGSDPRDPNSVANGPPTDLNSTSVLAIYENQPIGTMVGEFNATDPDNGNSLSYYFVNGDNNNSLFSLDENGTLSTATDFDYESLNTGLTVQVEVRDNYDANISDSFVVHVQNVNEAPVITNGLSITLNMLEDGNLTDSGLFATDPDAGEILTWSYEFFGDRNETIHLGGSGPEPQFSYFPIPNFNGMETLRVRVTDNGGLFDECSVSILVNPVEDSPIIVFSGGGEISGVKIPENQKTVGAIGVTEADGDNYTFEIVGGEDSEFFVLDSNTGELNFIHAPDYESPQDINGDSTYEVIVQVIDENGNFDRQTILVEVENMIDLSTFIFSNAGKVGPSGPLQSDVNHSYKGTDLDSLVEVNTQGVQEIIIPFSGEFKIDAMGASGGIGRSGGSLGGKGAAMSGDFLLNEGERIYVVVGQMGADSSRGASGGGGSFVWRYLVNGERELLVAAGGGGGGADGSYHNTQIDGRVENAGGNSVGSGGLNGEDGSEGGVHTSFPGRGWNGDIFSGRGTGGFGGGGGGDNHASGGGGGYSGGGSSSCGGKSGGGGGSFNAGTNQVNQAGVNEGHGKVIISALNTPPSDILLDRSYMPENLTIGTTIGYLSTIDPDDVNKTDQYLYHLVAGEGADSNELFEITADGILKTASFLIMRLAR